MIGIEIDVRADRAEGEEAEVFVRSSTHGPLLMTENPSLALAYKVEAVISLLRDIESDFGMLSLEMKDDNNRVICEALQRRVQEHTDDLEANLTEHTATDNSVLETFGYMWSNDYKETLFLPAFRKAVIEAGSEDDMVSEEYIRAELARIKAANKITDRLDGGEIWRKYYPANQEKLCDVEHLKELIARPANSSDSSPADRPPTTEPAESKGKVVLVHADGGKCHGTPLVDGKCPSCGITPDGQSIEARPAWVYPSRPAPQDENPATEDAKALHIDETASVNGNMEDSFGDYALNNTSAMQGY